MKDKNFQQNSYTCPLPKLGKSGAPTLCCLYKKNLAFRKEEYMKLTKEGLIQQVYKQHEELTKTQATDSVEAFLRISKSCLISGSDLLLSGFGKFNVRDKAARRGRNPQTGEELMLDARRVVTFNSSSILRNKTN